MDVNASLHSAQRWENVGYMCYVIPISNSSKDAHMVYNGGAYNNTDPRRGEALADSIHVWYNWMTKRDWYFLTISMIA
jgi:hypothetical protein